MHVLFTSLIPNACYLASRPLLHALVEQGIRSAYGVELDEVKVSKAEAFLTQSLQVRRPASVLLNSGSLSVSE
jgi:hypothetical protein